MTGYNPAARGCTVCGTQHTATVDGVNGRRCAAHPPGFSRRHYDGLVQDRGNVWGYLRTVLRLRRPQ